MSKSGGCTSSVLCGCAKFGLHKNLENPYHIGPITLQARLYYKHLISPHKETVSFVSLRPSMFPGVKPRGTLRFRGDKAHCFLQGQSVFCYMYTTQLKNRKKCKEIVCLTLAGSQISRGFKSMTWSHASQKLNLLFPWVVGEFCSPLGVSEFWPMTCDTFSSNWKTLSWEL